MEESVLVGQTLPPIRLAHTFYLLFVCLLRRFSASRLLQSLLLHFLRVLQRLSQGFYRGLSGMYDSLAVLLILALFGDSLLYCMLCFTACQFPPKP